MRVTDAITYLVLSDSSISTEQVESRLAELDFEVPTTFCVSSIRTRVVHLLKLMEDVGAVEPGLSVPLPDELRPKRRLKRHKLRQ